MDIRVPETSSFWNKNSRKALERNGWRAPNQLVRMRSAVQIRPAAPKILENFGFRGFFVANSCFAVWPKIFDPHRDPRRHKLQITRFTLVGKARSFHCASVSKRDPLRWARVWLKRPPDGKICLPARFCYCLLGYITCPRTVPMVWAASSCFCRVAWV